MTRRKVCLNFLLSSSFRKKSAAFFGRSPPEENRSSFWVQILGTCGGLAAATGKLVAELRITFSVVTAATNVGFPGFRSGKCVSLLLCQLIPTQLVYGIRHSQLQMPVNGLRLSRGSVRSSVRSSKRIKDRPSEIFWLDFQ
jgi:hypothetical protein